MARQRRSSVAGGAAKSLQGEAGALMKRIGARPAKSGAATGLWGSKMGKVTGFLEIDRADRRYAPASDRIRHYREFVLPLSEEATRNQAARCMNCGIPYCHGTGSVAPGDRKSVV